MALLWIDSAGMRQALQLHQLQKRLAAGARAVALQLAIAVLCMAVARYTVF